MSNHTTSASSAIVTINSVDLRPIEVDRQRVVTLAMIDEVHGRPSGTARRSFNTHRSRLTEGKHFGKMSANEFRTRFPGVISHRVTEDITYLNERGYLMLVKSFTDDLAWEVQDMLVASYFNMKLVDIGVARKVPRADLSREARLTMAQNLKLAKMAGLTGNQALLAANKGTAEMTGINSLVLMGITHMNAPQNENLLCPTDIAKRIGGGVSARAVNLLLTDLGLQTAIRDHRNVIQYEPTQAGVDAGGVMQDTDKRHSTGAPVRQLRWASSIVHVVEDAMQQDHAA